MSDQRKPLSKKASRALLFGLIVATLFMAFLAAYGIKSASENEAYQQEVEEMRRLYDPEYKDADSTNTAAPDSLRAN